MILAAAHIASVQKAVAKPCVTEKVRLVPKLFHADITRDGHNGCGHFAMVLGYVVHVVGLSWWGEKENMVVRIHFFKIMS